MSGKTEMSGTTTQEGISKVVKPAQKPMEPSVPQIQPGKIIERQAGQLASEQPREILNRYFIEGTQHLPRDMICGEDKNTGCIHCNITSADETEVDFDIQSFTDYENLIDDHMEQVFNDTCVVDVSGGPTIQVCKVSMDLALIRFDQFIFASEFIQHANSQGIFYDDFST